MATPRSEPFFPDEIQFLRQGGLFAWKERITTKIRRTLESLYGELAPRVVPEQFAAPPGMDFTRWQLVRGERFHGQPYVYLDFPQYFARDTKFTYRTMVWWSWGVFFAWILEGDGLALYRRNLLAAYDRLADRGVMVSIADTPWEWRTDVRHALPVSSATRDAVTAAVRSQPFLKVQAVLELDALATGDAVLLSRAVEVFEQLRPIVARN